MIIKLEKVILGKLFIPICFAILLLSSLIGCAERATTNQVPSSTSFPTSTKAVKNIDTPIVNSTQRTTLIPSPTSQAIFRGEIAISGHHRVHSSIRLLNLENGAIQSVSGMGSGSISWSPDGQWIAFEGGIPGTQRSDIFLIKLEKNEIKRLTNSSQGETDLNWSPDGRFIVYTYNNHSEPSNLALINIDNGETSLLTATKGYEHHPVWSPDGRQIAYLYFENTLPSELWVMDIDSRNSNTLIETPIAFSKIDWSPDGEWIVFISAENTNDCGDIFIVRSDGSDLSRLTNLPGCATDVIWSPDGEYLAFVGRNKSIMKGWQIYVIDATGKNIVAVTGEEELSINDIDWSLTTFSK